MSRKCNRFLAFLLAIALVTTTFSSDFASTRSFAVESGEELEQLEESSKEPSELEWEDIDEEEKTGEDAEEESEEETEEVGDTETSDDLSNQASEGAVDAAEEEATNGGEVKEEPVANAVEGETAIAASESTSGETESTESASAATSASIEEAADAASLSSTEIEEKEQTLVTVTYKASMGGRVSLKEETVDLSDEEAKFEGSEATAWDRYQFTEWVDEEGITVSTESFFVPSDVEKDTTFTAKFMKLEKMPEIQEQVTTGGMNVSVKRKRG